MDRVRIGMIGLGIMGEEHVKICQAHPLTELGAVSDIRQARLDEICACHGIANGCRVSQDGRARGFGWW